MATSPTSAGVGEEKLDTRGSGTRKARRWVVERTFAWLSKCRAPLVRYEKKAANYLGLMQLACLLLWFRRYHKLNVLGYLLKLPRGDDHGDWDGITLIAAMASALKVYEAWARSPARQRFSPLAPTCTDGRTSQSDIRWRSCPGVASGRSQRTPSAHCRVT